MSLLKDIIDEKLDDVVLQKNLTSFGSNYKVARDSAYSELDFNSLKRDLNQNVKVTDVKKVLELFSEFKTNVEKSGSKVYSAKNANEACRLITDICQNHNAKTVVKSKSMTSEEIHLNSYLEKFGIDVVESDLGEWILQLAKETPSHMVVPAIHKSREQIGKLFEDISDEKFDNDIDKMVAFAREQLRSAYFNAEVGITSANVAVASTGSIGLVTNEGNARLTSTLPPVHIVLVGYEKLVRDFKSALKVVNMLPKSATGQKITTYTTWIKGSNPSFKNPNGTKEIHYIFLDNGRLDFFEHENISEALKCIRCGSCANICPIYELVGGHLFGDVYTGAIGLINTMLYSSEEKANDILKLCIGCKACSHNCPSNIDLEEIITEFKQDCGEKFGVNAVKKFAFSKVLSNPKILDLTFKTMRFAQKPFIDKDRKLKFSPLPKDKDFRELPTISKDSFTNLYKKEYSEPTNPIDRVFFYPGCAIENIYPDMGLALINMLKRINVAVDIPEFASCCGAPAHYSGDRADATKMAKSTTDSIKLNDKYSCYLTLCPTCGASIKESFTKSLRNDPERFKKANRLKDEVKPLVQYLEEMGFKFKIKDNLKVTYHSPCHQERGMGVEAIKYLKEIIGQNYVELTDYNVCCGFGGSYSIDNANISKKVLDKKLGYIEQSRADILITDCPGCVMQIGGGAKYQKLDIEVMHLSEFLLNYVDIERIGDVR